MKTDITHKGADYVSVKAEIGRDTYEGILHLQERHFKRGQRIRIKGGYSCGEEEYILALTEAGTGLRKMALIGATSGNRWKDPIKVKDEWKVTEEELNKMLGSKSLSHNSVEIIEED